MLLLSMGAAACRPDRPATDRERTSLAHLLQQADAFLRLDMSDSAFAYGNRALALAATSNDRPGLAASHRIVGALLYQQGAYTQALEHQLRAHELLLATGEAPDVAASYHALGWTYYYTKQPDLALRHFTQAYKGYKQVRDISGEARSLGYIGHIHEKRGQFDQALDYQHRALALYRQVLDSAGMADILERIGSVYEDMEAYDDAASYFGQAMQLNEATGSIHPLVSNYNNLGDIFQKTGRYADAIRYTQQALALARNLGDKYQISSALRDLGETYHLLGDEARAYEATYEGRQLYEEIYTEEIAAQIALTQTLFETERMRAQIEVLEKARRFNQLVRIVLLVVFVLLLLVGFLIIKTQQLRLRKNREIFETQQRLLQAEVENSQLNEARLQQELEANSKALTSHALHIIQKNRILEELRQGLETVLKAKKSEQKDQLKALLQLIDYSFTRDQEWQDFRQAFEQVHHSFFDALRTAFPDLSPADLRLCALIRLGMDSKDIATVLGISTDSLRISRYRLKKKLGLGPDDSLSTFIHQV
ncbi:MAG: hypothetical protein OHK0039_18360 [Bacteroidia bacterium]